MLYSEVLDLGKHDMVILSGVYVVKAYAGVFEIVDLFVLLGAVSFPGDVLQLKEVGVHGVVTLYEPYETLVPTSIYHVSLTLLDYFYLFDCLVGLPP
ncbi:hypothetical protein KSS87_004984 [Heliosperma pusillum]|nr:hypothetical protein KSS87_004984 [Heliosperma pusillum]